LLWNQKQRAGPKQTEGKCSLGKVSAVRQLYEEPSHPQTP